MKERGRAGGHEKEDVEDEAVADPVALVGRDPVHDERDEEKNAAQQGESPGMQKLEHFHMERLSATVHRRFGPKKAMLR